MSSTGNTTGNIPVYAGCQIEGNYPSTALPSALELPSDTSVTTLVLPGRHSSMLGITSMWRPTSFSKRSPGRALENYNFFPENGKKQLPEMHSFEEGTPHFDSSRTEPICSSIFMVSHHQKPLARMSFNCLLILVRLMLQVIIYRTTMGKSWTGKFPIKNKSGERFLAIATNTPIYDDDGSLVGIICVSSDSQSFQELATSRSSKPMGADCNSASRPRFGLTSRGSSECQQPLQVTIASKISNLTLHYFYKVGFVLKRTRG